MQLGDIQSFRNEPIVNPWEGSSAELQAGVESARAFLRSPQQLLVGDSWVDGEGGTYTNANPNNREERFGPFAIASVAQAEAAVQYAQQQFGSWSRCSMSERATIVRNIRKRFDDERWTIMGLLMLEVGKTGLEAYADWAEAVDFLDYYANAAELLESNEFLAIATLPGFNTRMHAKPLGVGVSLPPFNFPNAIFAGMWAAPTVVGNVMVVKPSPRAPGTGIFVTKLFAEAGAPVQLVCDGNQGTHDVSQHLVRHKDVALISFTGSRYAGGVINQAAAETSERWIKRVVAEMGGCDFIAVHDYDDLDYLVDSVQASALGYQGQKCSALSRLIIRDDLYDTVKSAVVDRLASIAPQDVTQANSVLGGVIDERAQEQIIAQCGQVTQAGGSFLTGGKVTENFEGFGVNPSVHEGLDADSGTAGMEIFGPVFGMYKASNFDELVRIANNTPYALTGAVFTQDDALKARIAEFSSGNTYINRKCTGAMVGSEPFGGWYGSGTDDKAGHWSHLLRFIQWQTISEKA